MSNTDTQTAISMPALFANAFCQKIEACDTYTFIDSQFGGTADAEVHNGEFERRTFEYARNACDDYEGGKWERQSVLDKAAFFVCPVDSEATYEIGDYVVDNKTFGLICSLIGLDEASCRPAGQQAVADIFYNQSQALIESIVAVFESLETSELSDADRAELLSFQTLITENAD
jgi:hypothetical protein